MIIRNTYDDSNRSGDSSSVDPTTSFDAFKCKEAILRGEEIHFAELDGNSPTFGRLKCLPAWQRQQVPAKYLLHPLNCDIQGKKSGPKTKKLNGFCINFDSSSPAMKRSLRSTNYVKLQPVF
ncbi:hypothetical protein X798_02558 [Onchocerca flexuosa]|uniref:Uncharacterized protein n=1 Tax=Onchocerca flexuosa TaxID=387005 RepID=A0A238BZK5_9BILA|nr:hypothetical protein X798_02558 [Onchocerca flexuosa]